MLQIKGRGSAGFEQDPDSMTTQGIAQLTNAESASELTSDLTKETFETVVGGGQAKNIVAVKETGGIAAGGLEQAGAKVEKPAAIPGGWWK